MKTEIATFGGGCFWCIEAIIQRLKGIKKIESGYSGGTVPGAPTYREVCSGLTGHAEVVQVTFDSDAISFVELITVFMTSHDPTQLNGQGADIGTQYRSVIYYHDDLQKGKIEAVIAELKNYYSKPIVTEVSAVKKFHPAEIGHQNYFNNNRDAGYCKVVIEPKVAKLRSMYADRLKD